MSPSPSRSARRPPVALATPAALSSEERAVLMASAAQPLHEARNATKARVYLVEWPPESGQQIVVKDGARRAPWFRVSIGRLQLGREWKTLGFLQGMPGVPQPLFRAGADAIGMEWCKGQSLLHFAPGELPASAVEHLEKLVGELHARGVTHGDLHRDNILFDPQSEQVWLIDWATSCVFGPVRRGFKAWMWREWGQLDRRALAKIKARYTPELLGEEDRFLLENGGTSLSRAVRRVGSLFKGRKRAQKTHSSTSSSHASV